MKFKKTVSILLAVMMLASMLQITGMAKNAYTVGTTDESLVTVREILFHEDFNSIEAGTAIESGQLLGDDAYYQMKAGVNKTVEVRGNGSDNYLYLRGAGDINPETGAESFTNEAKHKAAFYLSTFVNEEDPEKSSTGKFTGTYVTEFRWKQTEGETGLDAIFCQTTSADKYGTRLSLDTGGLKYRNGSTATAVIANSKTFAVSGVWHNAKVVTYMGTQKYDLYIDNRLIVSGANFMHNTDIATAGVTEFARIFRVRGVMTAICYDDITIYREATDRTVWAAEDFSGYAETRDWKTWQNPELATTQYVTYDPNTVDKYDTLLEGMELFGTVVKLNGVIDSETDELKMTAGGKVILDGYSGVTKAKDGAGVSFKFRAEKPLESHGTVFRMSEGNAKNTGVFLTLSAGAFMVKVGQNEYQQILPGVQANRDYHFTFWCDRTSGKFSVYIDGKCVASGMDFVRHTNPSTGDLYSFNDMARMLEIGLNSTITGACYYDDFEFFYDKRDNIAQKAMMALNEEEGLVDSIAAGAQTVTFPGIADGYAGYTLNWTSSDNDAINPETGAVNIGFAEKYVTLTAEVTDANSEYTLKRNITVRVPAALELVARWDKATNKVVCNSKTLKGNYDGSKLLLAIYDAGDKFVDVKLGEIASGTASIELSTAGLPAGKYTIKAFALDDKFVPQCVNEYEGFAITE